MPSHVRIFFWIIFAVVTYSILSHVWHWAFQRVNPIGNTIIVVVIIVPLINLILAWLAAFRRQNWARWAFAAIFVSVRILSLWPFLYLTGHFRQMVLQAYLANLMSPRSIAVEALSIAAIVFVFTGNARDWFKKSSTS